MRRLTLITLGLLCAFITTRDATAQCPTPPDFPSFTFNPGPSLNYVICPGCTITVQWCWRHVPNPPSPVPGGYKDFAIGDITMSGSCIGCTPDLDSIINVATRDIIVNQNPWTAVIPDCPQTNDNWRVSRGGCRTDWLYDPINNRFVSLTCSDIQCWFNNRYCWETVDGERRLKVTTVSIIPATMCEPRSVPWSTHPVECNPHCE